MINKNLYVPLWDSVVFSQAISLGNFCHAAQLLKAIGCRKFSGPFDWIFNNPRALAHILSDDFATFLNRSYYQAVAVDQRIVREANLCQHSFYKEKYGVHHMFNHHSPDQDEDFEHYNQAVKDFRLNLSTTEPVLMLMVTHSAIKMDLVEQILSGLDRFSNQYKLLLIRFVSDLQSTSESLNDQVQVISHDSRHLMIDFKVRQASNGVVFPEAKDNERLIEFMRTFHFEIENSHE